MAEMGPPRIARMQQASGKLKILHPHVAAGGIPRIARAGGEGGAGGGGGGGLARSFGGGAGETRESSDPAVTGQFERSPYSTWFGHIIGGGELTERGKMDKADYDALRSGRMAYAQAISEGAMPKEAAQAAVKAGGVPLLAAMIGHPNNPLASVPAFHQFLGQQDGPVYSDATKEGQQVSYDPYTGEALGAKDIPGFRQSPDSQKLVPITTDIDPKTGKQTISYSNYDPKSGLLTPVLGPNGERAEGMKPGKAGPGAGLAQADIAGLPPQETSDTPKTAFNRQNYNTLAATPDVMAALGRIQDAAAAMGPIKGPLAALSGEYFGLNGTGAQFKADRDLIQSQAQKMAGSGYAAATKNFMEGIGTASNAPSFLKLQAGQLMTTLRDEGQSLADKETADHQGKLPPSLTTQLIKQGIVPNGYQSQQTFDGMPPGEAALWKSRFAPQALAPTDKAQLALDAAHGKFGPPGAQNTNADFKNIIGIRQQDKAQEQAKQQQGVASTAAKAAQQPPASVNPAQAGTLGVGQPGEGAPAGAGQPQPGAPGQQQPVQQVPAPAPQDLQQNGDQGQAENPQGSAQAPLPGAGLAPGAVNPLMPPTAVPGQPAQGMPATNATTPQPPASPLPLKTSQMLTPQGSVPTPATQAPVSDTTSEGDAAASLPPLSPDTIKTLREGGVPTNAIETQ